MNQQLVITSLPSAVAGAREWLRLAASGAGLDKRGVDELELAFVEGLTNVIRHSYHGAPDREIWLLFEDSAGQVACTITHEGMGFDRSAYRPPDLGEPQVHGYGVFIMEQVVDEVVYSSDMQGKHSVRLVKKLSPRT